MYIGTKKREIRFYLDGSTLMHTHFFLILKKYLFTFTLRIEKVFPFFFFIKKFLIFFIIRCTFTLVFSDFQKTTFLIVKKII